MAPSMATLLAGRLIQGQPRNAGGLGYAVISVALPKHLWDPRVGGGVRDVGRARLSGPPRAVCSPNSVCGVGDRVTAFLAVAMRGLVVFSVPVRERHRGQGCARTGFPCCRYPYRIWHWR